MANDVKINTLNSVDTGQSTKSNITGTTVGNKRGLDTSFLGFNPGGVLDFIDVDVDSTPGTEQLIYTEVVAPATTKKLYLLYYKSIYPSSWRMTIDNIQIASGFTGPGYPMDTHKWLTGREISAGQTIRMLGDVAAGFCVDKIGLNLEATDIS